MITESVSLLIDKSFENKMKMGRILRIFYPVIIIVFCSVLSSSLVINDYFSVNTTAIDIVSYISMFVILIEKICYTCQWCVEFKPYSMNLQKCICIGALIRIFAFTTILLLNASRNWCENLITKIVIILTVEKLFDYLALFKRMYNILNGIISVILAISSLLLSHDQRGN